MRCQLRSYMRIVGYLHASATFVPGKVAAGYAHVIDVQEPEPVQKIKVPAVSGVESQSTIPQLRRCPNLNWLREISDKVAKQEPSENGRKNNSKYCFSTLATWFVDAVTELRLWGGELKPAVVFLEQAACAWLAVLPCFYISSEIHKKQT